MNINLNGKWKLSPLSDVSEYTSFFNKSILEMNIPGDIHSSLIEEEIIKDPYIALNELDIQWVGEKDWRIERNFILESDMLEKQAIITLSNVDTFSSLYINDSLVLKTDNQFKKYVVNISSYLQLGDNKIRFDFTSAAKKAKEENDKLDYTIPTSIYPVSSAHRNLVRKTQCHSGWDWGPCIMCMGIYDDISINFTNDGYVESLITNTVKTSLSWALDCKMEYISLTEGEKTLTTEINGVVNTFTNYYLKGLNTISFSFDVDNVELWWPNGYGEQTLYELKLNISDATIVRKIGFRTIEVKTDKDESGSALTFCVNGLNIFAKGSNWIPVDALPSRMSEDVYKRLLGDSVKANMNMIRLWGGGMYEKDIFYNLCDELGLLIWHDMMFSCSMYPSSEDFLINVEKEIDYQIKRLQYHSSIALWCGNNEDLGAISWYEETKENPIRYVVDYDRLNEGVIGKTIKKNDPSRKWWPSSPCAGEGAYSDNWHDDSCGDMHFWSVWHSGKEFEAYYSIKPRFVSEFGYQSFPSFETVSSYAEGDYNLTSPALEHHQKNPRGNSIIIENFTRYYRFPNGFKNMLYLSQVQQAEAIKMAVCHFRSLAPHCMGSIIWQLNDNWPVCSWSSIEYSGKWKLLHYSARKFYQDIIPIIKKLDDKIYVYIASDKVNDVKIDLNIRFINYNGETEESKTINVNAKKGISTLVCEYDEKDFDKENIFIHVSFDNKEDTLLLTSAKNCKMKKANIVYSIIKEKNSFIIKLKTDYPAFNVCLDTEGVKGNFSDNNFILLDEKIIKFDSNCSQEEFEKSFTIQDLLSSSL